MRYFVGIDNGGTATKATVFDESGRCLASAGQATPLIVEREGFQERDIDVLWSLTAQAVRNALEKAAVDPAEIAGVGCTGHGKGLYLWGKDGRPAYRGIASTDSRAESVVESWQKDGTAARAARRTLQPVSACQPVALLAWLREHEPQVLENVQWIFEAKDYIRFRLTGEAMAELTDYSGSSLMDLNTMCFDPELLELFGLGELYPCLPPLCEATQLCGRVTAEAAVLTGIPEGTPVCGGMFDIDACAVAMGVLDPEQLCVITGTWSINEYISPKPVEMSESTRNSLYCVRPWYLIEESSATSAGNLEWIRENLLPGEKWGYGEISAAVEKLPPEDSGLMFLPYLYGTNTPGCGNAALVGLNNAQDPGHILRAVFEGVVYSHRLHVERLLQYREKPAAVRLAGGAAASEVWVQMFADGLGLPVEVLEVSELGGLGCAMAAAVAAGVYAGLDEAAKNMCGNIRRAEPDPVRAEIYSEKFSCWNRLRKALADG